MNDITPETTRRVPSFAVVLMAGSLVTALALGARSTMGLFLDPISDGLELGTSTFGLTVAIQNLVWGLGQPVAGAIADRYGTVRVLLVGVLLYVFGLLLLADATTGAQLHLGGGLVMGLGLAAASFSVVLASIGRLVPPERRSFALGMATAFGSVGQFVLIPVVQQLINRAGWRTAMVVLAGVVGAIILAVRPLRSPVAAASVVHADVDAETLPQVLRRAARHRSYILLNLAFFVCGFHVTFIGVHLPKHLEDLGQSEQIAAWALAGIGLFNIVGSFTAGILGQRMSKTRLLSYIYAGRGVAFLGLLLLPASAITALLFSAVMGVLWLSTVPLTSGIVLGQFGLKHAGTLFGLVFLTHQLGAFAGSYGGGAVRDAAGSYAAWWWVSAGLAGFAAVVHMFIDEGPADQPPTATAGERLRRVGFRRPRLVPGIATAGALAALTAFTVVTLDTSAEGIEARKRRWCASCTDWATTRVWSSTGQHLRAERGRSWTNSPMSWLWSTP